MAQNIYVVRGLGLGDDEDAYENMGAFTLRNDALAHIEMLEAENAEDDVEIDYDIEELILN
jgi:hypothetical protein